jgi:DNA-binding CsgD family transcriptional regulator
MQPGMDLIAREREHADLDQAIARAGVGHGGLLLVAGEAGIGKTVLVREALARSRLRALTAVCDPRMTTPFGPLLEVFRGRLRAEPGYLSACGPLTGHLALLLPELGPPAPSGDAATLSEAVRCALLALARSEPVCVFLDDLHWADSATLDVLPAMAQALEESRVLLIGAYRSDDVPRGHALRRMRGALRRHGRLREIVLTPLDADATAALASRHLAGRLSPALAARLHSHTEGVPFFVEEVAAALRGGSRLKSGPAGLELDSDDMPLPESVREAVMLRVESLSPPARRAVEIAAVVGPPVDLALVAELAGTDEGLDEAIESRLLLETEPGRAAFRHTLVREAVYGGIAWSQRRRLHRRVAESLEARGGHAHTPALAEHWLAAHELRRGRMALLDLADRWCGVHAYRDAGEAIQRAIEIWPPGEDEPTRLDVLDRLGSCAQMCGDLAEAARAWREVAEGRDEAGDLSRLADVQRRLGSLYELQRMWEPAMAARLAAAIAFDRSHLPGEAAAERMAVASHLRSAGQFRAALDLLTVAREDASRTQRWDLSARILGLEGNVRARMGEAEQGVATARAGLALALEHNLVGPAGEVYQRLADSLEHAGDYAGAETTYLSGFDFCRTNAVPAFGQVCVACLSVVLRQSGEWERATEICREVLASPASPPHAQAIGHTVLGIVAALRGGKWAGSARTRLLRGLEVSRSIELAACELLGLWGLALADEARGEDEAALVPLGSLLVRWRQTEDRHYAVAPLRWAATHFARMNARSEAHACADALAEMASATGQAEGLSALAHALGEAALAEGRASLAADQFGRALDALGTLELPFERAHTLLRAGVALAAAGQREAAIERLVSSYHGARNLGARPLARRAAQELARLGEAVDRRLGRRAAGDLEETRLSRRELEVLGQIRMGRTNREIAGSLFLSPRTVDMHVRNLLSKLDARTRAEAVSKAIDLGLLS